MDKIPPAYFGLVIQYFALFRNDTEDFRRPHLRRSVQHVYPLFVFLYVVLVVVGVVSNVCVLGAILRRGLHHNPTYYFMCNLAVSDLIKCLFVLPVTLAILLIQNWVFGSFLCFCIPMMQHIPIHASMLTFLLMAVDRYRLILFPMKSRMPRFLCVLGIWVLSVCVVLPFAIYIKYLDLEELQLGSQFEGTGLCMVNVADNMAEYIRGLFIVLYVLPLAIVAFLHVRISGEIKCRENPLAVAAVLFEMSSCTDEGVSRSTVPSGAATPCPARDSAAWPDEEEEPEEREQLSDGGGGDPAKSGEADSAKPTATVFGSGYDTPAHWRHHHDLLASAGQVQELLDDDGFEPRKEKRTQKYLITMVTLFAMCLCPLEIMRLVKNMMTETNDNTGHFDLAYIIFVWIGFLPTCITPILFASYLMSRPAKDRLRGYFRFSNRNGRRHHHHHRSSSSATSELHRATSGGRTNPRAASVGNGGQQEKTKGGGGAMGIGGHSNEGYVSSTQVHLHPGAGSGTRKTRPSATPSDEAKRSNRRKSLA